MCLRVVLAILLVLTTSASSLGAENPCQGDPRPDPTVVGGSCEAKDWSWLGTTISGICSSGDQKDVSLSLDMSTCATCDVALLELEQGLEMFCTDLLVEMDLTNPIHGGGAQPGLEVLQAVDYSFQYLGSSFKSDSVTTRRGERVTFELGEELKDLGFFFHGLRWLWYPDRADAKSSPITHVFDDKKHRITLIDSAAKPGAYVFLFELKKHGEEGVVYLTQDPTLYNPSSSTPPERDH